MIGFKDGGTIANPSDDKVRFFNKSLSDLPSNNVTALAVDFDNKIWIGTDMGFAILYNSNGVFDAADAAAQQYLENIQPIDLKYHYWRKPNYYELQIYYLDYTHYWSTLPKSFQLGLYMQIHKY